MQMKYHLIPANYNDFDFDCLREEEKAGKGSLLWKYVSGNGNASSNKKRRYSIGKYDICYFYYSNLPDLTSRILLRAEVIETDCKDQNGNDCFKIANISAIRLKDADAYSLNKLVEHYSVGKRSLSGKQHLQIDGKHKTLYDDLTHEVKGETLNEIKKYFRGEVKCYFSGRDHNPKTHESFLNREGIRYVEIHHIILKNNNQIPVIPKSVIEDPRNKVYLCPTCHRKIHLGKKQDVLKMEKSLYERYKGFYNECFIKYGTGFKADEAFNWLFSMIYDYSSEE